MRITCFVLLFILLLVAPASAGDEAPVALAWKFTKGDCRTITYTADYDIATETMGQTMGQSQSTRVVLRADVSEVAEDGSGTLDLRYLEVSGEFVTPQGSMQMSARRDEKGSVVVDVTVEMMGAELLKPMLEKMARNELDGKIRLVVDPSGRVTSSSTDLDLFKGVATDDPTMAVMVESVKVMLRPEELVDAMAAETFVQLPTSPVEVGAEWETERGFSVAGFSAHGVGKARLAGIETEGGTTVAKIEEKLHYDVSTEEYTARISEMFKKIGASSGSDMECSLELRPVDGMTFDHHSDFLVDDGAVRQVLWRDLAMRLEGSMTMVMMGQANSMPMSLKMTGSSKVVYAAGSEKTPPK